MTKGKSNDDGYRGYHIYYRRSNYHYPIEIQFFTNKDFKFNIWLHTYVYKYKDNDIGVKLRKMYDSDKINDKKDFERCLEYVLFNSKRF